MTADERHTEYMEYRRRFPADQEGISYLWGVWVAYHDLERGSSHRDFRHWANADPFPLAARMGYEDGWIELND